MSSVEELRTEVRSRLRAHPTGTPSCTGPAGTATSDTVYAGSDEIRRTLIAERILGLPKEVRA
ncbi:hypothetical protein [Streptomyces sp. NBC_01233]|uniref:hypothetical protein n=1 Tax=Streptomyces sp. NBC_01233 TaxID=2903787 RepID=UPI002E0E92DC|nr:hypothetical protein OG332_11930 [Streptomyces sp. NBC_01233]